VFFVSLDGFRIVRGSAANVPRANMKHPKAIVALVLIVSLTACSTPSPAVTRTPSPTVTLTPSPTLTSIPTATLTATPTDIPLAGLKGLLFFDYNGSGLREKPEPPIVGMGVCVEITGKEKTCIETDENGQFDFSKLAPAGKTVELSFVDSNKDRPDLSFRYINSWRGPVTIPAYEMNGVQVPEQNLNDTKIIPIEQGIKLKVGNKPEIGLMQGFLTLPFVQSQVPDLYIWGYFDIMNSSITCGTPVSANGTALNYDGKYTKGGGGNSVTPRVGVGDGHEGLDYSVPIGSYIINASPNAKVWLLPHENNGELRVHTLYQLGNEVYQNAYGHLNVQLVALNDIVYRGQIIGISGKTGASPYHQLHFDLSKSTPDQCNQYLDPFRTIVEGSYPDNFSGSYISYWTMDNNSQFAK